MRPTSIRPGISRPRGQCSAARTIHAPVVETEAGRPQASHRGVGRGTGAAKPPVARGLGGDHQHLAVPSANTAAKATIFAEHASIRGASKRRCSGDDDRRATPPTKP